MMKSSTSMALLLGVAVVLPGCAHNKVQPLYVWDSFPQHQYQSLLHENASNADQILELEGEAEDAKGDNEALPPGFRAHLGMLYLDAGDTERARQMWLAEKEAFPESTPYMDQLLTRLNSPEKTAKSEKKS